MVKYYGAHITDLTLSPRQVFQSKIWCKCNTSALEDPESSDELIQKAFSQQLVLKSSLLQQRICFWYGVRKLSPKKASFPPRYARIHPRFLIKQDYQLQQEAEINEAKASTAFLNEGFKSETYTYIMGHILSPSG